MKTVQCCGVLVKSVDISIACKILKKIRRTHNKGYLSVWGTEKMPPHPDLKIEQANKIISWIMKNCADSNVNYLPGLAGVFRTKAKSLKNTGKGLYVLTASYTDHGLGQIKQQHKEGRYTSVLRSF